ncbi:hypothetical protein BCV70DRAFT_198017 [Testicularia cyperi]|uniref:SYO1-like TPR repeats domain-containing protein n=1 Tax=Testicularia cyperi TaxID=1882483 RepID=A0A317Y114_9BASI|nr:hypothetical protein BCV70DRAFT_198017 [Testicularia cyperi]
MPKSGFDPQRHQRRAHRHNPLGGGAKPSSAPTKSQPKSAALDALQEAAGTKSSTSGSAPSRKEIVPLLSNLPAPDNVSSASAPVNLADKVWSLASVSLLLTVHPTQTAAEVKQNRKLLLGHNLVGRLLHALQSHTEVEVRREASGALRNLCVDAGVDVRNEVVNKGGVDAILSVMRWISHALGFVDAADGAAAAGSSTSSLSSMYQVTDPQQSLEAKLSLLAKPLDQMNKKEKRHATKLATLLGKSLESLAGQNNLSSADLEKLASSTGEGASASLTSNGHARAEPFLALDTDTRKGLLETSESLATVVWCLCESGEKPFAKLVSWKWLDPDLYGADVAANELRGEGLASWLASALSLGCRAATILSTTTADGSRSTSSSSAAGTDALAQLSNEELSLLLDLALASGNALCGLTDGGEAEFIDGFLARQTPKPAKKGGRPVQTALTPIANSLEQQPAAASRRLAQIQAAITLLQACVETPQQGIDRFKRFVLSQTTMLGVLAAGTLRNLAAAVDVKSVRPSGGKSHKKTETSPTSSNVFLPSSAVSGSNGAASGISLRRYEESVILPTLAHLLAGVDMVKLAHDIDGKGDLSEAASIDSANKDMDEAALRSRMQMKAEEKAQTLSLALEILAEMAGALDSKHGDDNDDDEWLEDLDAPEAEGEDDVDMEQDMEAVLGNGDDDDDDNVEDLQDDSKDERTAKDDMRDTFAEAVKRSGRMPFEAYAPQLCRIFSAVSDGSGEKSNIELASCLLTLARPFEASFPSLSSTASSSAASSQQSSVLLRGLHSRSLSVLNNLVLRLATLAPPPPSQPASDPKQQRRIAAFRAWIAGSSGAQLSGVFRALFEIARGCASVPAVAVVGDGATAVTTAAGSEAAIASAKSSDPSPDLLRGGDEATDGLQMVETCIGTMWSVSRCFEGRVSVSWGEQGDINVSQPESLNSELIQALMAGYSTASTDGMRVKCLGLLSVIGRCPDVHPELNRAIGSFLIERLEAIPEGSGPVAARGPTSPETLVAVVNGLIDMYADETSSYDSAFRTNDFLGRMRLTLFRCKTLAKQIDRRKQISLRASAEEAIENLQGFIQYRQSLRF